MSADLQTSFIPKSPINTKAPTRRSGIGVVTLTSIVLILVVAIAYGGLFAFGLWLDKEIGKPDDPCTLGSGAKCSLNASIKRVEDKVRRELITEIKETGERIALAEKLLMGRTQMTRVFTALEDLTLLSIQMTDFSYSIGEPLKLKGVARGYEPIALQSDELAKSKEVTAHNVSDLTLDSKTGKVTFALSITFSPSVLNAGVAPTEAADDSVSTTPPITP